MRTFLIKSARRIRGFVESPVTRLVVGVVLLATAIYEIEEGLLIEFENDGPRAHHGMAAFGILTMIAAIPDLLEGLVFGTEFLLKDEDDESSP